MKFLHNVELIYLLQVGADIVKRALSYPMKLIAKNAGVNGSVVIEKVWLDVEWLHVIFHSVCSLLFFIYLFTFVKMFIRLPVMFTDFTFLLQVLSSENTNFGYNAATGNYEDLMAAGIIDPTKASVSAAACCF